MFKRPLFWLGLLLGGLASFRSLQRETQKLPAGLLLDLTSEAVIACGRDGAVFYLNAAARTLFSPSVDSFPALQYPNGQRVPPGQLPLSRVLSSGQLTSAEYHCMTADGAACVFDVSAFPLPGGGAAAVLQNVTALQEQQRGMRQVQAQQAALRALGRRLSASATLEATSRAVAEETYLLLRALPDVQVRLYGYNPAVQTLTRLAAEPEDRPKRPQSLAQARPPAFPFDAGISSLWQLYIDREPSASPVHVLGEAEAASVLALPLLSGGVAVGHLSISSSAHGALSDPALRETLEIAASAAALALAGPQSAELVAHLNQQRDAVQAIAQAIAGGSGPDTLADVAAKHIKHVIRGICTVSIAAENGLQIVGTAYQDDLLFPERAQLDQLALHGKAVQKAWRTQKIVTQFGAANPGYEKAVWRAFAGTGCHSVIALPLLPRLGVLVVMVEGALPLPDGQRKFLEIAAALLSIGLGPATAEASRAER